MWGTVESTRVKMGPLGNGNKAPLDFESAYQIY